MTRDEVRVSSQDESDICRNVGGSLFKRGGTAMTLERLSASLDFDTLSIDFPCNKIIGPRSLVLYKCLVC